jgi:hypothetical protein
MRRLLAETIARDEGRSPSLNAAILEATRHVGRSPMQQGRVASLVSLNQESGGFKNDKEVVVLPEHAWFLHQ